MDRLPTEMPIGWVLVEDPHGFIAEHIEFGVRSIPMPDRAGAVQAAVNLQAALDEGISVPRRGAVSEPVQVALFDLSSPDLAWSQRHTAAMFRRRKAGQTEAIRQHLKAKR